MGLETVANSILIELANPAERRSGDDDVGGAKCGFQCVSQSMAAEWVIGSGRLADRDPALSGAAIETLGECRHYAQIGRSCNAVAEALADDGARTYTDGPMIARGSAAFRLGRGVEAGCLVVARYAGKAAPALATSFDQEGLGVESAVARQPGHGGNDAVRTQWPCTQTAGEPALSPRSVDGDACLDV